VKQVYAFAVLHGEKVDNPAESVGKGCRPAAGAVHRPRPAPHEDGRSSRSIYNKAEYAEQRRHMLQEWANMVDAWIDGQTHVPKLMPENVVVPMLSAIA
jgi:hypothetical protein